MCIYIEELLVLAGQLVVQPPPIYIYMYIYNVELLVLAGQLVTQPPPINIYIFCRAPCPGRVACCTPPPTPPGLDQKQVTGKIQAKLNFIIVEIFHILVHKNPWV